MRGTMLILLAAGCGGTPDYGPPTATTQITVSRSGGFAPPGTNTQSAAISGSTVTFTASTLTDTAAISSADVAAIIDAMQAIDFLELKGDYGTCASPATDAPDTRITASLAAGTNDVSFYTGCSGGVFDDLATLQDTVFDRSGFTAWLASH